MEAGGVDDVFGLMSEDAMSLHELETAARNDVPLTVFVTNDSALGAEYHRLVRDDQYAGTAVVDTPDSRTSPSRSTPTVTRRGRPRS